MPVSNNPVMCKETWIVLKIRILALTKISKKLWWQASNILTHVWGKHSLPHELWNFLGRPQKIVNFISKFHFHLSKENRKIKLKERPREILLTYCRSMYICWPWNKVFTRCCVLTWVTKILMRAILIVQAGRIWSGSCRFATLVLTQNFYPMQSNASFSLGKAVKHYHTVAYPKKQWSCAVFQFSSFLLSCLIDLWFCWFDFLILL